MVRFPKLLSGSENADFRFNGTNTSVFVPVHIFPDREVSGLMSSRLMRLHRIGLYDISCIGFIYFTWILVSDYNKKLFGLTLLLKRHYILATLCVCVCVCVFCLIIK